MINPAVIKERSELSRKSIEELFNELDKGNTKLFNKVKDCNNHNISSILFGLNFINEELLKRVPDMSKEQSISYNDLYSDYQAIFEKIEDCKCSK